MAKTANLTARIEPEVKEQAEEILNSLGLSASSAINLFYNQIIMHQGLPFPVRIPEYRVLDESTLSVAELSAEINKGYEDIKAGRIQTAEEAFDDIRKEFNI